MYRHICVYIYILYIHIYTVYVYIIYSRFIHIQLTKLDHLVFGQTFPLLAERMEKHRLDNLFGLKQIS